jgi:phosphate uptake regulator
MELRKVNQVGKDTLTISLPKIWVKVNEIQKGDQLKVSTNNQKLTIKPLETKQSVEKIDTKNLNTFLLNKLILNAYMNNTSKIIINIENEKIYDNDLEKTISVSDYVISIISTYMGMEIVSYNNKEIVIQNLFEGGEVSNLSMIKKRTASLFTEFLERIISALDSPRGFSNLKIENDVINVRKFIYHNMRLIVESEDPTFSKIKFYVLYDHIDNSLYSSEKLIQLLKKSKTISNKCSNLIKEIFVLFIKFLNFDKEFDADYSNKLILERQELLKDVTNANLNSNEKKILRELRIFLNLHNDFVLANLR